MRLLIASFLIGSWIATTTVAAQQTETPAETPAAATEPSSAGAAELTDPGLHETFDHVPEEPDYVVRRHDRGAKPLVADGRLQLLSNRGGENNSIAWPVVAPGPRRQVSMRSRFRVASGVRGLSFMLLGTARCGQKGPAFQLYKAKPMPGMPLPVEPAWDEPNVWGSFAVALDLHDPPTEDPFDEHGNVHDRPQRQLSLHYDGREVANRFCPTVVADGADHEFVVDVDFVTGGAEVSVSIDGDPVYERYLVPHMQPFESRPAVGARAMDAGLCTIDELHVGYGAPAEQSPPAIVVQAIREGRNPTGGPSFRQAVQLLPEALDAERVWMTLRLQPMVVRDEWDRVGHVSIWHEGERYELARILTPFMNWGQSYTYTVDVTDYAHMLRGLTEIGVDLGPNQGGGFAFDLDLTCYARPADVAPLPRVIGIRKVWSGVARFEVAGSPLKVFGMRRIPVPATARSAQLRIVTTGHGQLEFEPLDRWVMVGEVEHHDRLWTEDCYLNPWRPQFGTWKYDRAGWGPGSLGREWRIDLSESLGEVEELTLSYRSDEFRSETWATHRIESVVVFYGDPAPQPSSEAGRSVGN